MTSPALTARIRRSGHFARACALAFVAALLGQIAGAALEKGAAHVRCAEHGELTHVEAAVAVQETPGRSVQGEVPRAEVGHEHCPFSAILERRAASLKVERFLIATLESPPRPAAPVPVAFRVEQQPLLDTAPKTSPPRA
jgi:hypothetical protein